MILWRSTTVSQYNLQKLWSVDHYWSIVVYPPQNAKISPSVYKGYDYVLRHRAHEANGLARILWCTRFTHVDAGRHCALKFEYLKTYEMYLYSALRQVRSLRWPWWRERVKRPTA